MYLKQGGTGNKVRETMEDYKWQEWASLQDK